MSVLDASLYAEAVTAATPLGDRARQRLAATQLWHAPSVLPAEVMSVIRRLAHHGSLASVRAERARRRLLETRFILHPFAPFADRVWELRDNLTVYDAWYVALAERLGTPLVTTDTRLARAPGPVCVMEQVSV